MTNADAAPFVPDAPVPDSDTLKVRFRAEEEGDRSYILGCWSQCWMDAPECRHLIEYIPQGDGTFYKRTTRFRRKFQDCVAGGSGVLWRDDTRVLVGCSPEDRGWIWCFLVFTPGRGGEPTALHWMNVRPNLRSGADALHIRRLGLGTRMLAVGNGLGPGLRQGDSFHLTCMPGRQTSHTEEKGDEIWGKLDAALVRMGLRAEFMAIDEWLGARR
jgi:hypothetical protein